jgi:hypothetical protein
MKVSRGRDMMKTIEKLLAMIYIARLNCERCRNNEQHGGWEREGQIEISEMTSGERSFCQILM